MEVSLVPVRRVNALKVRQLFAEQKPIRTTKNSAYTFVSNDSYKP